MLDDLLVHVGVQELAGVVAGEAPGHLGQVVGAEAEELGLLGDDVSAEGGARNLDHGADLVGQVNAGLVDELVGHLGDDGLAVLQLVVGGNQGHHNLGNDLGAGLLVDVDGGLDDGLGLHLGNLRPLNGQTAAAHTHHGVDLGEADHDALQILEAHVHVGGQIGDVLVLGGQELVQGGIQQTDGDGHAGHGLEDALEVAALHGQNLLQSHAAFVLGGSHDHLAHGGDAVFGEEHVLGTDQAHALGAEVTGDTGVMGIVGVGADLQLTILVRPLHDGGEVAGDVSLFGLQLAQIHVAGGAVQGDVVALTDDVAGQSGGLGVLVHDQAGDTGHAAAAHAAGHDGGVRGAAAAGGQDALGDLHAHDVLGGGLLPDQNHGAVLSGGLGVLSGEVHSAAARAGGGGHAGGHRLGVGQSLRGEVGVQHGVEAVGLDHQQGFLLGDEALVHQIHGDLQSRAGGALAVPGLEHVQLAPLDGELHVLHVMVVVLQPGGNLHELVIDGGVDLLHLGDVRSAADAGHHVLALSVHQEVAKELLLAGGRVTGEGHAGAGVIAPVAEDHGLHVDGGAPVGGNVVHLAVDLRAGVVPGAEHGPDGLHELNLGVLREVVAHLLLVVGLELLHQTLHVLGQQLGVQLHAALLLDQVDEHLEVLLGQLHDHVGEHLDEAAVGVIDEAGVAGELHQALGHHVVDAQVQDGVHHAGHGGAGAGAHGDQQGVLGVAELLAVLLLQNGQLLQNLSLNVVVDAATVLIVLSTGLGGDGEALGYGHARVGHLSQVGALAAQQLPHVAVAFVEHVNKFLAHNVDNISFKRISHPAPGAARMSLNNTHTVAQYHYNKK